MTEIIDTQLFIGGVADGQRRMVLHGNRVRVLNAAGRTLAPHLDPSRHELGTPLASEYREELIRGDRSIFRIWVADQVTIDDALDALFSGYNSTLAGQK